eukprot:274217-Chlamydomonas_euryale.AAC.13
MQGVGVASVQRARTRGCMLHGACCTAHGACCMCSAAQAVLGCADAVGRVTCPIRATHTFEAPPSHPFGARLDHDGWEQTRLRAAPPTPLPHRLVHPPQS